MKSTTTHTAKAAEVEVGEVIVVGGQECRVLAVRRSPFLVWLTLQHVLGGKALTYTFPPAHVFAVVVE